MSVLFIIFFIVLLCATEKNIFKKNSSKGNTINDWSDVSFSNFAIYVDYFAFGTKSYGRFRLL